MNKITLGGEQHEMTEDQEKKIQAILKPKQEKWVPEDREKIYIVTGAGRTEDYLSCSKFALGYVTQNNAYRTKEQAEARKLRNEGAEERYMPEVEEEYKTIWTAGGIFVSKWDNDFYDMTRYHSGLVWEITTPDEEIQSWIEKYKSAWMTK